MKTESPKLIQIVPAKEDDRGSYLYGLDSDGRVWVLRHTRCDIHGYPVGDSPKKWFLLSAQLPIGQAYVDSVGK